MFGVSVDIINWVSWQMPYLIERIVQPTTASNRQQRLMGLAGFVFALAYTVCAHEHRNSAETRGATLSTAPETRVFSRLSVAVVCQQSNGGSEVNGVRNIGL